MNGTTGITDFWWRSPINLNVLTSSQGIWINIVMFFYTFVIYKIQNVHHIPQWQTFWGAATEGEPAGWDDPSGGSTRARLVNRFFSLHRPTCSHDTLWLNSYMQPDTQQSETMCYQWLLLALEPVSPKAGPCNLYIGTSLHPVLWHNWPSNADFDGWASSNHTEYFSFWSLVIKDLSCVPIQGLYLSKCTSSAFEGYFLDAFPRLTHWNGTV